MNDSHIPSKPQTITISMKTILMVLFILLGLFFLWYIREIIFILLAALLLSALIEPFANTLARRRIPRGLAVLIVYVILGAVTTLMFLSFIPVAVDQVLQLLKNLQVNYEEIAMRFGQLQSTLAEYGFEENFKAFLETAEETINTQITTAFSTVTDIFYGIGTLFVILVLTFYMVNEEEAARKYAKNLLPKQFQPFVSNLLPKMQKKIGAWLRGQMILALLVGTAVYIGLTLLGVNYALLLAILAGLFEIVPYVGPIMSTVPAVIIAFAQHPVKGVFVLILYIVIQQLENHVLVPKVMQKITGLNPIISIVALLIGIKLGGGSSESFSFVGAMIGALLSIPVATMIVVALEEYNIEKIEPPL